MTKNSFTYGNYDSEKIKNLHLKIANSRGRKPVLKELGNIRKKINSLLVEINPCDGKDELKSIENTLKSILAENI